jgi:hypothetical protein
MGIMQTLKRIALGDESEPIPVLGRNDSCWCGSGKKYKRCHLATDERKRSSERASALRSPAGRGF